MIDWMDNVVVWDWPTNPPGEQEHVIFEVVGHGMTFTIPEDCVGKRVTNRITAQPDGSYESVWTRPRRFDPREEWPSP